MKIFHCNHCEHLLFFENTTCLGCGRQLAYLPDVALMSSLDPVGDGNWKSPLPEAEGKIYRLCKNYTDQQVCNWALPASDPQVLCVSCRMTRTIPDLWQPENRLAWYRLEVAKRRVIFTLLQLSLPVQNFDENPQQGLVFEFKSPSPGTQVVTGHANGVITNNVAEADDVERERQKKAVHEPYRTVVGHFRHEIGHYYWDRLIRDNAALIGGLGIALGAILAASLPSTRAEANVVGKATDQLKRAAGSAAQTGFEAAKDTVFSAAEAAARSVSEADLGKHASRITEGVTERLKEVAEDVVTTAFDPSRNPNN